ncbi:autotransporter outer membrane beta-barrel domain-containing protein [Yersinia sp. LJYL362]|uniref:autotransporter outer membrane beta-barrel domain-containing protein n=1 Tax=Yersinia sp. LJYL362 TaxID=3402108 RepID=UPI003AB5866D
MNKVFKVIWNSALGRYDVASEFSTSGKKTKSFCSKTVNTSSGLRSPSRLSQIAMTMMNRHSSKALLLTSATIFTVMITVFPALAAQQQADGISLEVPADTTIMTTAPDTPGIALWALNSGQITAAGPITASTSGQRAYAAYAQLDGDISLTGSTLSSSGINSHVVVALTGGQVGLDNTSVVSSGSGANAAYVNQNGVMSITDSTLSTSGINANVVVVATGGQLKLSNTSITSSGVSGAGGISVRDTDSYASITDSIIQILNSTTGGYGIIASASQVDITGTTIETNQGNSIALMAETGAIVNISNSYLTTNGLTDQSNRSYGAYALSNSQMNLTDVSIQTQGNYSNGVNVTSGATAMLVNSNVITNGSSANGIAATSNNSQITIDGGMIATIGDQSSGVFASTSANVILSNSQIITTGANAMGIQASTSGVVTANNTDIQTSGENADAINIDRGNVSSVVNFNQQDGNLHSINGKTFNALGGTINATLNNSSIINNGILINADTDTGLTNFGIVNINANNMVLNGDIQAGMGSQANLSISNTQWNGVARNGGQVGIGSNAIWNMMASSDVAALTNAGTINFSNPVAADVLTIHGDYIGNNGNLLFNTELNDDNSVTDKMIVEGNTSGNTLVSVTNAGGSGATTLNGIELIQVNGLSDGDFVQSGRIVAGAYDYSLARGVGTNASNWYLTSLSNLPFDPENPVGPGEETKRPEAGSYTANLAAANNMFVTRLHDRLGETQYIDALTGEQKVTSMWLRNEGGHNRSRDTSGQLKTQSNRYVMQLGGDIAQWSNDGLDHLHLGVMAGYGNSKSDTHAKSGYKSSGSVDGYTAGVYSTWYANDEDKSGLYVDGWAQYSWFNNGVQGDGLATEEYKSKGITASVESGYTFKIGENQSKNETYFIQPKAQITWMGVKADEHREANGTQVSGQGDGNIQTRLGLRSYMKGNHESDNGKDREFQPFVEANWIHNAKDFGTSMNAVDVKQAGAKNIGELKLGVEGQLNKQLNIWGNVGQQLGDKGYSDTAVMLGAKYNF